MQALQDLFNSTNGPRWTWKPGTETHWYFGPDANPCENHWQGVNCTLIGNKYHVRELDLTNYTLQGTIPNSIGNLDYLTSLVLRDNQLNGTVPQTVGDLAMAQVVVLSKNYLSGTVPPSIGTLDSLQVLELQVNNFNGTLPDSFFYLSELRVLSVSDCYLSGTLPDSIGNLASIQTLALSFNLFNGTIPDTIGQLNTLEWLLLSGNWFSGTIPSAVGDLKQLAGLFLSLNKLHGALPQSIGDMQLLGTLALYYNELSSTIPATFAQLSNLQSIVLAYNKLTGTVPEWLSMCTSLETVVLSHNQLHSALPASWSALSNLTDLQLGTNRIMGTVPQSYGNLTKLLQLRLGSNQLQGSIPVQILLLPSLQRLDLSGNHYNGSIPYQLQYSSNLVELMLSNNSIKGTIPAFLGNLTHLQYVQLDHNELTGSIPTTVSALRNLIQLTLDHNNLHGTLDNVFTVQHSSLAIVSVGQNTLSGTLPDIIFNLTALTNFVAASNCFTGPLPDNLCHARTLHSLVLDGFQSSKDCKRSALPGIVIKAYTVHKFAGGTVPACLFSLPSLNTLHLASNGIGGTLPSNVTISTSLVYLSLSHNLLVGTIPRAFQEQQWVELDLCYNRLRGSLLSTFAPAPATVTQSGLETALLQYWTAQQRAAQPLGGDSALEVAFGKIYTYGRANLLKQVDGRSTMLALNNNRLSGILPGVIMDRRHMSVLKGNMFDCKYDKSDLPHHDSTHRRRYTCGSSAFNIQFYSWLLAIILCVSVVLLVWRYRVTVERYIGVEYIYTYLNLWLNVFTGAVTYPQHAGLYKLDNLYSMNRLLNIVGYITLACLTFIVLLMTPMYLALAHSYSTHLHKYAWIVSAAYLSGIIPVMAEIFVLAVTMLIMLRGISSLNRFVSSIPQVQIDRVISLNVLALDVALMRRTKAMVYVCYLILNFVIVMGANVAFIYVAQNGTSAQLSFAQVWLSIFKVLWNNILATRLLRSVHIDVGRVLGNPDEFLETKYVTIQIYTALLNNILIPCIVVAVQSSQCFANLLRKESAIAATYVTENCEIYDAEAHMCMVTRLNLQQTQYTPPFAYSYQCTSSLITSYVPAFINVCIVTTFAIPIMYTAGQQWYRRATPGTMWYYFLQRAVPPLVRMSELDDVDEARLTQLLSMQLHANDSLSVTYFNVNRLVVMLVTQLAIMLTFGALFPPLAVAVGFTVASIVYVEKIKVGRFVTAMIQKENFKYVHIIELECQELGSVTLLLRKSVWLLMVVKSCFYALVMFDTLGDTVGLSKALWVLFVLPAMPLVLYCAQLLYYHVYPDTSQGGAADARGTNQLPPGRSESATVVSRMGDSTNDHVSQPVERPSTTVRGSIVSIQASRKMQAECPASAIELQEMGGEPATVSALHTV